MAGYVAPAVDPGELELLASWGAFIALVDDGFDRDADRSRPEQVRDLLGRLVAVLEGRPAPNEPAEPAVRALAELWQRTRISAHRGWPSRFIAHYRQFAQATHQEALDRAAETPPGLERYLAMRRHTITVLPMLDIVERTWSGEHEGLEALREAVADTIAWTNDLTTADQELRDGQDNLLSILARERGLSRQETAAAVRDMLSRRMDDFDTAASALLTRSPGLRSRVEILRTFRDGALTWSAETHRNRVDHRERTGRAGDADDGSPGHGRACRRLVALEPRGTDASSVLEAGIERVARQLSLAVSPVGAILGGCASRVLETALLAALLRDTGSRPDELRRIEGYLRARQADADPLDRLLIDSYLEPGRMRDRVAGEAAVLMQEPGGLSGGRRRLKTAMMHAVLHLVCGAPLEETGMPAPMPAEGSSLYSHVNLLAVRVIYAHATGRHHLATDDERARLADLAGDAQGRLLWESSATTDLLALHAIRRFRPGHPLIAEGILRLLLAQNADHGIPYLDGQEIWLTCVAGVPFLGHPRLRPLTVRMAAFIAGGQAADGGWSFTAGMRQTDVDTATRCMEFLYAADHTAGHADRAAGGRRFALQLQRAARYLVSMAAPSGGFTTWVRGDKPELDMTAGAVIALAPQWDRHRELLGDAVAFILDAQREDGTFEPNWSVSHASVIQRAVQALDAVPETAPGLAARISRATARAVGYLAATQNADGGWGQHDRAPSDVLSTAQALPVVADHGNPLAVGAATAYLLAQQRDDGSFDSIPDQVGPRPLPFDFPVLADIHALAALMRARTFAAGPEARAVIAAACGLARPSHESATRVADADWPRSSVAAPSKAAAPRTAS